ncbi:MAG: hypothetical protein JW841_15930 [Deltaproteobacteria bacterium]|nr:hypothetical protein [Deltaproteobacteria bacterium]
MGESNKADEGLNDLKARMALTFRWYLGFSSRWALTGEPTRQADYQIWCGPAIGSFNRWVKGTWLEPLESRDVSCVATAILFGAATLARREAAVRAGLENVPSATQISYPLDLDERLLPQAMSACA